MRINKILAFVLSIACAGCVTVNIPKYVQDKSPYKKNFIASYEEVLTATQQALKETGWKISETANPLVYEQQGSVESQAKQILLFTQARQTPVVLTSQYMSLNVYVRQADKGTEVEIRYYSVIPAFLGSIKGYKNNSVVNRVFDHIAQLLKK